MDILKKNTTPAFQIVPRKTLNVTDVFRIEIRNESTDIIQNILCSISLLPNENYLLLLSSFPIGNFNDKFSYSLYIDPTDELVLMGKAIILSASEDVQNYSTKTNYNYYA
jgi:hypothetical protein